MKNFEKKTNSNIMDVKSNNNQINVNDEKIINALINIDSKSSETKICSFRLKINSINTIKKIAEKYNTSMTQIIELLIESIEIK